MAENAELAAILKLKDAFTQQFEQFREEAKKAAAKSTEGFKELNESVSKIDDNLKKVAEQGQSFGAKILDVFSKIGNIVTGIATAVMAIGKAFMAVFKIVTTVVKGIISGVTTMTRAVIRFGRAAVNEFREVAQGLDRIAKLAVQVGASARDLTSLRLAAELTGTSLQGMANALRIGAKNVADYKRGVGEYAVWFQRLGITYEELDSKVRTSADFLELVASRWERLGSDVEKTAAAQQLFGRSGAELRPILEQGADYIHQMRREVEELGGSFDAMQLQRVEEMNDAFTRVSFAIQSIKERVVVGLAPIVKGVADELREFFRVVGRAADKILQAMIPSLKDLGKQIQSTIKDVRKMAEIFQVDIAAVIIAFPDIVSAGFRALGQNLNAILGTVLGSLVGTAVSIGKAIGKGLFSSTIAGAKAMAGNLAGDLLEILYAASPIGISPTESEKAAAKRWVEGIIGKPESMRTLVKRYSDEARQEIAANLRDFEKLAKLPIQEGDVSITLDTAIQTAIANGRDKFTSFLAEIRDAMEDVNNMPTPGGKKSSWSDYWAGIKQGAGEIKKQFTALNAGMSLVNDSIYGVADAFESRLVEAWQNGFKNMGEVVKAFASDVILAFERIMVNQAIQWLIRMLFSMGGGPTTALAGIGQGFSHAYTNPPAATGAAYEGGIRRWARGGMPDMVSDPTYFPTRDGRWNVAGEAGDEFIMPAERSASGKMGVLAKLPPDAGKRVVTVQDNRSVTIDFNPRVQAQDARGVDSVLRQAENRLVSRVMEALSETAAGHGVVRNILRRSV